MSPEPFMTSQYDHKHSCDCEECADARFKARNPHLYGATEVTPWMRWEPIRNALICLTVIAGCILGAAWLYTGIADAKTPKPIAAPQSLVRERAQCKHFAYQQGTDNLAMSARIVEQCLRDRLMEAYQAIAWQRSENLKLARQMLGKLADWTCIHSGEGAWNAHTGNGYYGGLQMDATFERTYGRDMLQRYHAHADAWPPKAQIIVAQRAFIQGRGYAPWPNTSHACGLR